MQRGELSTHLTCFMTLQQNPRRTHICTGVHRTDNAAIVVTMTHPHTGNLTVGGRAFARPADGEEEQGEEVEDICEGRVETVVVRGVIVADFVQASDWKYCVVGPECRAR